MNERTQSIATVTNIMYIDLQFRRNYHHYTIYRCSFCGRI